MGGERGTHSAPFCLLMGLQRRVRAAHGTKARPKPIPVNIYVQSFRKDLAILIQTHYVELMVEPIAIFVLASV
jgi:hypothetical protein